MMDVDGRPPICRFRSPVCGPCRPLLVKLEICNVWGTTVGSHPLPADREAFAQSRVLSFSHNSKYFPDCHLFLKLSCTLVKRQHLKQELDPRFTDTHYSAAIINLKKNLASRNKIFAPSLDRLEVGDNGHYFQSINLGLWHFKSL